MKYQLTISEKNQEILSTHYFKTATSNHQTIKWQTYPD